MLPTVDALHAQLDAHPGNHHLRLVLADAMDEAAGAVACDHCGGGRPGEWCYPTDDGHCLTCSGTGRVSDGRAEIAAGLRVLAELGLYPCRTTKQGGRWSYPGFVSQEQMAGCADAVLVENRHCVLPTEWLVAVPMAPHNWDEPGDFPSWRTRDTRREIEDATALAWHKLAPIQQAAILVPAAKRP